MQPQAHIALVKHVSEKIECTKKSQVLMQYEILLFRVCWRIVHLFLNVKGLSKENIVASLQYARLYRYVVKKFHLRCKKAHGISAMNTNTCARLSVTS